jgi:hypothetical protein
MIKTKQNSYANRNWKNKLGQAGYALVRDLEKRFINLESTFLQAKKFRR